MSADLYIYSTTVGFNEINIKLPHEIKNGKWQIGLVELSYFKARTQFPDFDIYCDIIVPNIKNNQSSQILRRAFTEKNDITIRYNPIFYCDILRPSLDSMTLYLKADTAINKSFNDTRVYCTLHLRRND
jgi:hypothetical protein